MQNGALYIHEQVTNFKHSEWIQVEDSGFRDWFSSFGGVAKRSLMEALKMLMVLLIASAACVAGEPGGELFPGFFPVPEFDPDEFFPQDAFPKDAPLVPDVVPIPKEVFPREELPPSIPKEVFPREELPPPIPKEETPPKEEIPPMENMPEAPKEENPVPEIPIPEDLIPKGWIPRRRGGRHAAPREVAPTGLRAGYYRERCPNAEAIVKRVLEQAVEREARVAASLLRLHFHDCFVQGCDASVLLDDTASFQGEKTANPNRNSAKGFEVVDAIKAALERECEGVVSCADVLAIAARDSVVLTGGPSWEVLLGRRDSLTASRSAANRDIPPPNSTLSQLIASFARKGLSAADMVTLSGSHTIGNSRCVSFTQRLYNFGGTGRPDPSLDPVYLRQLQEICPRGGDGNVTTVLDFATPKKFDNHYYVDLEFHKGLLTSDQVLFAPNAGESNGLVMAFSYDEYKFFKEFAASMVKMGNISPLLGSEGQIRKNCRYVNEKKYEP